MAENDLKILTDVALAAALNAGGAIMEVYGSDDLEVQTKDDDSPVTKADLNADALITGMLEKTGLPVLSEEGGEISYVKRKSWGLFWLVDPLDGTKEFIDRSGDFTVNIALVDRDTPVAGVVYAPVQGLLYAGLTGAGAWKSGAGSLRIKGSASDLPGSPLSFYRGPWHGGDAVDTSGMEWTRLPCVENTGYRIVGSRSFMDDRTQRFIDGFCELFPSARMVTRGSSLKFCMLAEGEADIYPRFSNISEWDTAAGHAIVISAGGVVMQVDQGKLSPLVYNKPSSRSPWFIACLEAALLEKVRGLLPPGP